ncbi:MAG: ssDNA-binding domain-containing protein [Alicyclobacillus sp.]|nr:ssDNA-binding domain-containing protein [Alicyclobacillus sp.]
MNVYEIVTDRIIKQLEQGVIPWRRPWTEHGYRPVNWKTMKPYRGVNCFLLPPGEYATFKQVTEGGGTVKKGAKANIVVFWKWVEKEDEETGEKERIPILRYYNVFEINTQCEGLTSKRKTAGFDHDPIEEAEKIVARYKDGPKIYFRPDRAFYRPSEDFVSVPPMSDYPKPEEYYSTLFHELVHSTGHEKRLNREGITNMKMFGDENYSKEELVAELGSAMLCGVAGIVNETIDNSAAYIAGWLKALKNDKRLIVSASSQAQRAADHILGVKFDDEPEEVEVQ